MTSTRSDRTGNGMPDVDVAELLDLCTKGATVHGRQDLVQRLIVARRFLGTAEPGRFSFGAVRDAAAVALHACDALEQDLRARRAELLDPALPARVRAEYSDARARYEAFETPAQVWPAILGEGFAALSSDLEYEARVATRAVQAEADASIEAGDPGRHREQLETWLRDRLTFEAERIHHRLRAGARTMAARVAGDLGLAPNPTPDLAVLPTADLVASLHPHTPPAGGGQPLSTRLLMVVMPGYAGIMMAFVLSRFLGLQLPVWVIAVCAVLGALATGGAALTGDRRRQLERRRSDARAMVRAFLDDYQMALGKQVRDGIRALQNDLRTSTSIEVNHRGRELTDRLRAAGSAAEAASRTGHELADVDTDLGSVAELRGRARRLLHPPTETPPGRRLTTAA
jgi:hypothetical protein